MFLLILFFVLILAIGIAILVDCIRFWREIQPHIKFGLLMGVLLIVFDLVGSVFLGSRALPQMLFMLGTDCAIFMPMALCAAMGVFCCGLLGIRPFLLLEPRGPGQGPLLQALPLLNEESLVPEPLDCDQTETGRASPSLALPLPPVEQEALPLKAIPVPPGFFTGPDQVFPPLKTSLAPWVLPVIILFVAFASGYSFLLFKLTAPEISGMLRRFGALDVTFNWQTAVLVTRFAFVEEIVFRLGIQNHLTKLLRLGNRRYWLAILMTTVLWTLAHTGVLEPDWVKLVQIFPLGIALGFMFRRFGLETCIVAHIGFNLVMLPMTPYVIH